MSSCKRSGTTRRARVAMVIAVSMAVLAVAACGREMDVVNRADANAGTPDARARVTVQSFAFIPPRLTVEAGTEVVWVNRDDILHTITTGRPGRQGVPGVSEDRPATPDGMFDRELDGSGTSVSFVFDDAGAYPYYCAIHAGMSGTVVVR